MHSLIMPNLKTLRRLAARHAAPALAITLGLCPGWVRAGDPPPCAGANNTGPCRIEVERLQPDPRYSPVPTFRAVSQPRLALALSGGGGKGLAHIGVLQGLDSLGLQPDALTGTSAGSVMAALYAAGYSPGEIEQIFVRHDWNPLFGALDIRRGSLSESEETRRRAAQLVLRYKGGKRQRKRALFTGAEMESALNSLLFSAQLASGGDFNQLRVPLRVVTADAGKSEVYAPSHGDLTQLVRASMAVPGLYAPVEYEGRTLVDGMVASNIPVPEAAAMHPDFIIASDVTLPFSAWLQVNGSLRVIGQAVDVMLAQQQRRALELADFTVAPDVTQLSSSDLYTQLPVAVENGRAAVDEQQEVLLERLNRVAGQSPMAIDNIQVTLDDAPADPAIWQQALGRRPTPLRVGLELAHALAHGPYSGATADFQPASRQLELRFHSSGEFRRVDLMVDGAPVEWPAPAGAFTWETARAIVGAVRAKYTDAGYAAFTFFEKAQWDDATGVLTLRASRGVMAEANYKVDRPAAQRIVERRLSLVPDSAPDIISMGNRLNELRSRGVLESWSLTPAPMPEKSPQTLRLTVSGVAAGGLELRAGAAYRDQLKTEAFASAVWAAPLARGDRAEFTAVKSVDRDRFEAAYQVEYALGVTRPLGFTLNGELFHNQFPIVNAKQEYSGVLPWKGWQARGGFFTRTSQYGHLAFELGAERVNGEPFEPAHSRQFLAMHYDFDQADRVVVPTRGRLLRFDGDYSIGGLSYRRAQISIEENWPLHKKREGTMSARLAVGVTGGEAPFYARFNPGGWRDAYGFISYGLAASDYALLTANYRTALLDLGPIRIYGETGVTAARTADRIAGLRSAGNRIGGGVSLIALNDWIGPITLGYQINSDRARGGFLLIGFGLGR